jgi:hypothetical protein
VAAVLVLAPGAAEAPRGDPSLDAAFSTITDKELETDLWQLASAELEGRDSPSSGLERAAKYISSRFERAGLKPVSGDKFTLPFQRDLPEPVAEECKLELTLDAAAPRTFTFAQDFVPLTGCDGSATGDLVFLGFGIESTNEHFDEIEGAGLRGKIALIVEGEPRHAKRFDGPELTPDATLWKKLGNLRDNGLAGVLVARRSPESGAGAGKKKGAPDLEPAALNFRHTWATWNGAEMTPVPEGLAKDLPPALEISMKCADELLGENVEELARRIDKSCQPLDRKPKGRSVTLSSKTRRARVAIDNVVALLEGSDAALKDQYVVVGADDRGRIGFGADDNASGTAAMLEVVEALAKMRPRRSVLACAFAAEEDGLLGSKALCDSPPVPREQMVAMLNMDMVGRGDPAEVVAFGLLQNPALEKVLDRAKKLGKTGIKNIEVGRDAGLFTRSDHYSFHEIGVPVIFFFEHLPLRDNADYHTWRDTIDKLDFDKVARTARLVFNTAWLLANDEERPPKPRE